MPKSSFNHYPIHPLIQHLPLPEPALRLISIMLSGVVLASARDIGSLMGCSEKYISDIIKDLIDDEYVIRRRLGWEGGLTGRTWLTDKLTEEHVIPLPTCQQHWFLARGLERLPFVEHVYPALSTVEGLGQFRQIEWHQGLAFDASAKFESGWVLVFRSGLLETEADLRKRMKTLGADLREYAIDRIYPWPSFFLWVVTTQWQAELVRRVMDRVMRGAQLAIYVTADGTYIPAPQPTVAQGGISQPLEIRGMGGWPWDQRLTDSQWVQPNGYILGKVLDAVIRFPGAWFSLIWADTGVNDEKRVKWALGKLRKLNWIEKKVLNGTPRYTVTSVGLHHAARRDGVSNVDWQARSRVPAFRGSPRLQDHEDGAMALSEQFIKAGCLVEPAWRAGDDLGQDRGGVVPDGIVYLFDGPYGPGWYWIEYERSAKGETRAGRKLKGYLSERRRDNYPVIFVLWNETAEKNFQAIGQERGLRMVTTTISRLKIYGAVGKPGCWSVYGEDVVICQPANTESE